MIDKIHRFIYRSSLIITGLGLLCFLAGMIFLEAYKTYPALGKITGLLVLVTPFAPIGTLFGTLKESQPLQQKLYTLFLTGLSVVFLLILIWGALAGAAFA